MKYLKKIILISLILSLSLTLVACGETNDENQRISVYNEMIKKIYSQSPEMNDGILFLALDIEDIENRDLLNGQIEEWLSPDIEIKYASLDELKEEGLYREKENLNLVIEDGLLISLERDGESIVELRKFKGDNYSIGMICEIQKGLNDRMEYNIIDEWIE